MQLNNIRFHGHVAAFRKGEPVMELDEDGEPTDQQRSIETIIHEAAPDKNGSAAFDSGDVVLTRATFWSDDGKCMGETRLDHAGKITVQYSEAI